MGRSGDMIVNIMNLPPVPPLPEGVELKRAMGLDRRRFCSSSAIISTMAGSMRRKQR